MEPIRTKEEYEAALARAQELESRSLPEESEELEQLRALIAWWEKKIVFFKDGDTFTREITLDWGAK